MSGSRIKCNCGSALFHEVHRVDILTHTPPGKTALPGSKWTKYMLVHSDHLEDEPTAFQCASCGVIATIQDNLLVFEPSARTQ